MRRAVDNARLLGMLIPEDQQALSMGADLAAWVASDPLLCLAFSEHVMAKGEGKYEWPPDYVARVQYNLGWARDQLNKMFNETKPFYLPERT